MIKKTLKNNYFIIFSIFAGIPIFFIPNSWDGEILAHGFQIENISGIEKWYKESSSNFQLILIQILFIIKKLFNINHEFLFDLFNIITLVLFSTEVKKHAEQFFSLDNKWSNFCAVLVITFPVWHSLNAFNLTLYLFCFYLALSGYRLFFSKKIIIRLTGVLLILFSFSVKSNFALVFGLACAYTFKNYLDKKNLKVNSFIFIIFLCISSYIVHKVFFSPYGFYEGYNEIKLEEINIYLIAKNFYSFSTFFLFYLWIPFVFLLLIKLNNKNFKIKKLFLVNNYLPVFIIFAASVAPYCLIGKSSDIFFFSGHFSRHAYLVSISFGLFFAIFFKDISDNYFSKKIINLFMLIIVMTNLFILSIGQYDKIESAIFNSDFNKKVQKMNIPEGKIVIVSKFLIPVSLYEGNYGFYNVYGKSARQVLTNLTINKKKNYTNIEIFFLNSNDYKKYFAIDDSKNDCITVLQIENELNRIDKIKNLYVFNSQKYNQVKFIKTNC